MREYNEMMLRPLLHPEGRVHHDPERQDEPASPRASAAPKRRQIGFMLLGSVLLVGVLVS
jgi:hypothetical protein